MWTSLITEGWTLNDGNPLRGRTALVTGSSDGIGREIALELARRGAFVGVNSRTAERAARVVDEIEALGGEAKAFVFDVTVDGAPQSMVDAFVEQTGGIDVLVNNAGAGSVGASEKVEPDDWLRVMQLLLNAPFYCAQAAGRHMLEARRGVVINITSIAGHLGLPERAAYCAAKHGLVGLTRVLGTEWAGRGVRVLSIDPGYVATGALERSMAAGGFDASAIEGRTPMGRIGDPSEVARVAAFLATDAASYMTGASVTVDGGWAAYGGF